MTPLRRRQNTIGGPVSYRGIGLHSGREVAMRMLPAKEGSGIVFRRVDLPGKPCIPATFSSVFDTSRSTNLALGDVRVLTVEHLLAALRAFDIDNVTIELTAMEPPIGNGSSDVFVDLIERVGVVTLEAESPILRVKSPIALTQGAATIVALPAEEYRISYTLSYPQSEALKTQFISLPITQDSFCKELAPCRTFALYEEIAFLMDKGLIRGASLDNAVLIMGDAAISKGGLFFPDEMVRHKVLDIVGDLSLVGIHFFAHIIAIRSGHAANVAFARMLSEHLLMETSTCPM